MPRVYHDLKKGERLRLILGVGMPNSDGDDLEEGLRLERVEMNPLPDISQNSHEFTFVWSVQVNPSIVFRISEANLSSRTTKRGPRSGRPGLALSGSQWCSTAESHGLLAKDPEKTQAVKMASICPLD